MYTITPSYQVTSRPHSFSSRHYIIKTVWHLNVQNFHVKLKADLLQEVLRIGSDEGGGVFPDNTHIKKATEYPAGSDSCASTPHTIAQEAGDCRPPTLQTQVPHDVQRGSLGLLASYYFHFSIVLSLRIWDFLEKMTVTQLVKIKPRVNGTRSFIIVFTRVRQWFLSWARWNQSKNSLNILLGSILT